MYVYVCVCIRVDICKCTCLCMSEWLNVLLSWIDYMYSVCRNIYIHACTHIPGISYVCKILGVSTCFAGGDLFLYLSGFCLCCFFHVLDHSRQTLHTFWIILVKRWPNASILLYLSYAHAFMFKGRCGINKRALCTRSTYMSDIMSVYHVCVCLWVCVYVRVLCLFMHTHIYQIIFHHISTSRTWNELHEHINADNESRFNFRSDPKWLIPWHQNVTGKIFWLGLRVWAISDIDNSSFQLGDNQRVIVGDREDTLRVGTPNRTELKQRRTQMASKPTRRKHGSILIIEIGWQSHSHHQATTSTRHSQRQ